MLNTLFLISILSAHYVSDFILQSREIAESKSSSIKALFKHFLNYYTMFMILNIIASVMLYSNLLLSLETIRFSFYNAVSHIIIDYFTSKLSFKYYKEGDNKSFFNVIGFDQFLHTSIIVLLFFIFFGNLI